MFNVKRNEIFSDLQEGFNMIKLLKEPTRLNAHLDYVISNNISYIKNFHLGSYHNAQIFNKTEFLTDRAYEAQNYSN